MSYISSATTIAYVDARSSSKIVYLPSTFNIVGKLVTVKDIFGTSATNNITVATIGGDVFENGTTSQQINQQFGATQFVAQRGVWYSLNTNASGGGGGGSGGQGISSLSSIVSYGLSSIVRNFTGLSSLSSIVSYGLSSLRVAPGISSLSSIVSYGLSSLRTPSPGAGISSLSSILSYGLSTVADDRLRSNTWVSPFHVSSIGGTEIYDASTGAPDTYTNALAKMDNWLYKNIVDQPPAPTFFGQSSDIYSITCAWTNIFQFKVGILDTYAPYIAAIHIDLYSNVNSVNCNLMRSFVFSNNYLPFSASNFEVVEFTNSNPTLLNLYTSATFPTKRTLAIGIPDTVLNANNQPFKIDVYFKNYSSNATNILQFPSQTLGFISPPSAPESVTLTNPGVTTLNIVIQKPQFNASNTMTPTYPTLSDYRVILSNSGIRPRRFNSTNVPAFQVMTSNYPYVSNTQNQSLTNLAADSEYFASVAARNVINSEYGNSRISAITKTSLPVAPGSLTSIINDLANPAPYTTRGQIVFAPLINNLSVFNTSQLTDGLYFRTNTGIAIHTATNSGSTSDSLAAFTAISGGESNNISLNGFRTFGTSGGDFTRDTTNMANSVNITDLYSGNSIQNNFYLCFSARVLLRKSYLVASSNLYTFTFRHTLLPFTASETVSNITYNQPIYIDDLAADPSLAGFSNTSNSSSLYISGVPVYSYSNTITFNFDIANLARYYYITGQTLLSGELKFGTGTVLQTLNCNTNTPLRDINNNIQTRAPLSNISRIIIQNTFTDPSFFTGTTNLINVSNISLSNLVNPSGITVNSNSRGVYFDGPSQLLMETMLSNARAPGGERFVSEGGSWISAPYRVYDNRELIISNSANTRYNVELTLLNGLFRTGPSIGSLYSIITLFTPPSGQPTNAYSRLSNYSNIQSETGTRYVTFRYTLSNSSAANVVSLQITLNNLTGLTATTGPPSTQPYPNSRVPYFQYMIHNSGAFNTGWLDANIIRIGFTAFTPSIEYAAGVLCNKPITNSSRSVSVVPIPPQCNYDVFVKIGLTMNCNITFSHISILPETNLAPPRVTATLAATAATQNMTMTWNTPTGCNPPLDYYLYSINACNTDSTHPRRFVQSGARVLQEPNFLNNTCNSFSDTSYSYSATYSNFDTYYTGAIQLANDAGLGPRSNTNRVLTALPNNPNVPFGLGSNFDLTNKTVFPYSGYNFSQRGLGIIPNIVVSLGASATFDYLYNGQRSNQFTVNNSDTTGSGVTGFIYTGRLLQGGVQVASAPYQFITGSYAFSNSETNTSVTSGVLTMHIRRIQDAYTSGPATGYFLKAYVNISLSSLPAGSNANILTLSNTGQPLLTTGSIWVDNTPNVQPFINSIAPDTSQYGASYCNFVCGVISMANSNVHPFFIEACNIGSHFFRDTPITVSLFSNVGATGAVLCNIPFNSVTTPFYSSRSVTSIYTRGPISNSTFFLWNNSLSYPLYTPCNIASFNGSACNLYFNAATPVGFTYGGAGKNFYYDTFSLTVRDNTLTSNWSPTGVSHGIRVESGGSELYPAIGLFGADFNNNCNINVGIYSNEMQLVYGGYRTFCNAVFSGRLNGYLNYDQFFNPFSASGYTYPNYSVINSSNKRYVTMKYSFRSNVNSSNWQAANIRFTYDDAPFTYDTFTFLGIDVFYRIVASNDNSATTTNLTTAWLDANTIALSPPNANTKNTNGTPGAFNYVEISGDSNNTKVFFPSLNYSNVDFSFYVRVGIPMNCNISLRYIDLTPLSVGAVPGNLTNLVISNAQTLPLTNSLMSWNRADDSIAITNFYINYAAIGNSISGVTYPRRHLNTIISDTGSFNSNVTSVPTSQLTFNYTFTPSNYDTYYSGTVFASNISGTTPTLSNNSINSTPLPANTGADFASGLGLCNTNYAAIIYSRTGTLFKTVTTVAGSLIYNSNNFFQSGGISHPFQIYSASGLMSGITVNPTNTTVGPGLNTVNWSITLLSNGTQSATQSYTYPYSIYSSASNVQIINNTVWAWSNIGSADMYTGDIYRSNFYAITTPRIWVKTANILPGIPNRLFIRDVTRGLSNLVDFYVEIQNSSPTGSISLSNGGINFCNICGISVITSTSFNFWITANNIGSYFYFNPPVTASLSYTGGSGTFGFDPVNTVFYSNISLTSTQLSNPPLPSVVYFYWSNVAIATTSFGTTYALSGSTTNLFGTNTISGSFAPYYDPASIAMLTCNVRVESGGNTETPAAGDFGAAYNNNTPINTGLYGSELQLANGGYFSPRNTNSFSNYTTFFSPSGGLTNPNYSGLATNAWRYTTFLFSELRTANISNKVDTITYRLNWVNGFTPGIIGSPAASSTNTNSFLLDTTAFQMRIRFNSNTPTTTNDSSQWLNMNSNRGSAISISEKNTASIFCTSNISNYYFGSNLTFTVKVPDGCGYNSFSNYLRIGLNPGGYTNGLGLSNIQYIGQTEFNVPSLFTYSCNLSGSYTTTITLNLIQGLPTNTYFRLSNFLFYSNAGNTYSLSNTTTALIDPTIANYTAATASIIGNYSNLSIIYRPDNSEFWRNNYLFRINGLAPTLADFSVLSEGSNTFNARITPTLTNAAIQPQPVVFYWNVSNATPPSGGPTNVGPTALQGPITSGTTGQITSDICTFNRNFTFRIFASNAIGISGTSNIASRSGPQQSQPQPSITITTTTMLGSVLSYTISFGGRVGILSWGLNRNGGGFSVNNNTTADSISGTADTPSGYGYFSFYGKGFSSTAINTVSGCLTQSATASGGSSTTDFSIVTPSFNAANVTANTGSFTITIALNNVPTPPTFTPAVSLQTIWAVSGGSATITSQTNNGCSITASAANTTYTVSATYRMNDGTEIRDSSAGTQNVSVGGFLPVTGTISGRTFNTDITIDVTSTTPPNGATTSGGRTGARITGTPNYSLTDDTGNLIVTQTTTTLRLQMNNVTSISPFIDYSVSWTT